MSISARLRDALTRKPATPDPPASSGRAETSAVRAWAAFEAMQRHFHTRRSLYRRDGLHPPGTYAHLWPLSRAMFATLDLAGIPAELVPKLDAAGELAYREAGLERYWSGAAYDSDVVARVRTGGDRYYDDNAWIGLWLVQLERMGRGSLGRARELFDFARGGWDGRTDVPHPGGVFWVEQGIGAGRTNHDRNCVSTAPNAALGLHLGETEEPARMIDWVERTLDASGNGEGPFWDKVQGDGSIDRAVWTYNQGSVIGANLLLGRRERAARIARLALERFAGAALVRQPPAFNAIYFHNLLRLHAETSDLALREGIVSALRAYADELWARRDRHDLICTERGAPTLLDQGAAVQVFALLAWREEDYRLLA